MHRKSKLTTMPSSPIDRFPLSDSSTNNSFNCTADIPNNYDEESESEMKKYARYRFNQGHALLRKQLQRPIILQAQKTSGRRRFTFSGHQEHKVVYKKRRRFTSIVPPTKFLLGGNITDPLNLRSLQDEKVNQQLNAFSPASSPMPTRRNQVQLIIPPNINDPLNLNTGEDIELNLLTSKPRKRRRHRKGRREDENSEDVNQISPTDEVSPFDIAQESQIIVFSLDDCVEKESRDPSVQPESSNDEAVSNKIVSPVVPQGSPVKVTKKAFSRSVSRDVEDKPSVQKQFSKQKSLKAGVRKNIDSVKYRSNAQKFCYGNHVTNLSNWNYGESYDDDHRLRFLDESLFCGKDVLDIGCNTGQLAIYIAMHCQPRKVVGIDIDKKLVTRAQRKVRLQVSKNIVTETEIDFPASMAYMYGPLSKLARSSTKTLNEFPNNISLFEANYVPACEDYLETQKPEYDTILCLRVTKWIHLNFGDEGLKMAFKRMFAQLRNGGHLILEPQPWFTYSASKRITPAISNTYRSLEMRPDSFCEYLMSNEVGFSSCQAIGRTFHCTKAYRQDIFLLTKGYQSHQVHNLLLNTLPPIPFDYNEWTHNTREHENFSDFAEGGSLGSDMQH